MLTAVVKNNAIIVNNTELPSIGDAEILVKMHSCGICGSDLEKVFGAYYMKSLRVGHEPAGDVVRIGSKVKTINTGERVFVHHHVSCHACRICLEGDYTMCDMYQNSNIEPCGLSEYFIVPERNISNGGVLKLPLSVSFDEAALIEPLACCLRGINKVSIRHGYIVAIFGAGPTGLMHAMLAERQGAAKVILIDFNDFRLNFAKRHNDIIIMNPSVQKDIVNEINKLTDNIGVDATILATGNMNALTQALKITRRGGRILLFGVPSSKNGIELDLSRLYSNEHLIIPSYGASEIETNQALYLIYDKSVNLNYLITHRFKLRDANSAFQCAHAALDSMKVIIVSRPVF